MQWGQGCAVLSCTWASARSMPALCDRDASVLQTTKMSPENDECPSEGQMPLVESCLFSDNCLLHTLTVLTGTPGRAGSRWPQFWEPVCEERPRFPGTLLPARRAQASPGALPAPATRPAASQASGETTAWLCVFQLKPRSLCPVQGSAGPEGQVNAPTSSHPGRDRVR